jgi:undecaprenyl-diphosphatase
MLRQIQAIDLEFSRRFSGLSLPRWVVGGLKLFVRIGDGWLWLPVFVGVFLAKPLQEASVITGHCLLSGVLSLSLYWPIKRSVRRRRPFERLPGVGGTVSPLDEFSFPSGHIMNNLAVALTVAHYFPSSYLLFVGIPIVLGLLRIYFAVHFLSDVVMGGLLGTFSFGFSTWAFPL